MDYTVAGKYKPFTGIMVALLVYMAHGWGSRGLRFFYLNRSVTTKLDTLYFTFDGVAHGESDGKVNFVS